MDQRTTGGIGSPFGDEIGAGGIDDPGVAQPSLGRIDEPEAGDRGGSLDSRGQFPAEDPDNVPGTGADGDELESGRDNIRDGNVRGVMGGAGQA